jgi:2-polyprenyl-3-methyl-5-hydroxy-6-metoxy-1,4-benzoquinol methylase
MDNLYGDDFFKEMATPRAFAKQEQYGRALVNSLKVDSVIEFGCGCGGWLVGMRKAGAKVLGLEYSIDSALKYAPREVVDAIEFGDFGKPIDKGKFDCALSIEVVEHIPEECADQVVTNMVNAATKYVFLSAARPGQGGTGHINEQPLQYWIDKFAKHGFIWKPELAHTFRVALMPTKYARYIKKNTLIFKKD